MNLKMYNQIHFKIINDKNREIVKTLSVYLEQVEFIESVNECLQEAEDVKEWVPLAIYSEDVLVGFAMYGYFPKSNPGQLWLDRLLIDKKYQGRGYGKNAVYSLLDRLYVEYGKCTGTVYLSVYKDNSRAIRLYEQLGFRFNGKYDSKGEQIMEYYFRQGISKIN